MVRTNHLASMFSSRTSCFMLAALLAAVGVASAGQAPQDQDAATFRSLVAEGPLVAASEHTAAMMQLRLDDGVLRLDREAIERRGREADNGDEADRGGRAERIQLRGGGNVQVQGQAVIQLRAGAGDPEPIEKLFARLQAAEGGRGSSMAMGGDQRQRSFRGERLSAALESGDKRIRLRIEERRGDARRTLELLDDPEGTTRIQITSIDGELILINQSPDGALRIVAVEAAAARVMASPSFKHFYGRYGEWFEQVLVPALETLGVRPPLTPAHEAVIEATLARLRPDDKQREQQGRELIEALDDDAFTRREEATEALIRGYGEFRDLVMEKLRKDDISAEMRMRLQQVMDAGEEEGATAADVVTHFDLLDDPAHLVRVLEKADADDRPHVVERLKAVTGEDYGEDADAWKDWLGQQQGE